MLDQYPAYEVTIGIEVHVQLATQTKIFCACANEVGKEPNTNICNVCTGQPGVLPVLNKKVVDYAIAAGLATHSTIAPVCSFSRKHYFYPDLPKNYQITQGSDPICSEGNVPIRLEDGSTKRIRLMRIHMEEDAGKNIHASGSNESFVDLNRTGTPLLEIVTHPDIASTYEARTYLKALRLLVQSLGICSGNMEDGAFRADTNISVRKKGAQKLGTRCELKNINSFKFISDAIEYEIERQITLLESGGTVRQETRLWDTKEHKTIMMRSKEEAADYRYLTDPDLPLLVIDEGWIDRITHTLAELPYERFNRLMADYGLSPQEAEILLDDMPLAIYFETAYACTASKSLINWVVRDIMGYLKEHKIALAECKVTPEKLAALVALLEKGTINNHAAKQVFETVAKTGQEPAVIVKEAGLEQMDSSDELQVIILEIIAANPKVVADYKSGKDKLFGFFVGQVMQKTKGKGNPTLIQELLKKELS
ncbi:Asp-tRNA(Asn)/Glu-tRNA(Gln) amidotransferase subunit GatB [Candidatus Dependentiae bacterium]|nr:Asp-tRNA(Asn)/Glu-tRNA(Gln) amidotransferase subunit GatB [Candidatus Dependentiae bacterium]MCC7414762.1 Asp-tRNA(Asn)/Glu-tRNA(Gln) amidotransferase subunit GatB [Campylobacterota bacterium]